MFFTGGGEGAGEPGETVAIVARTGTILWRNPDAFASQTGTPSYQDGRIFLPGTYQQPLACLSAEDGSILWQQEEGRNHWYVDTVSLGPDYFTVNNKYEGGAERWNLANGTLAGTEAKRIQLWPPPPAHGCGSVVLLSQDMALSATNSGLFLTDAGSGKVLWNSPGFASFTCPHAIVSNGRIFYCPQTNGQMYCFEPVQ
jgi:outer membrane protein assembly factor BamB